MKTCGFRQVDKDELNGLLNTRFASPRELIYNIFSVALEDMLIRLLKRKAPLVLSEHGSEYSARMCLKKGNPQVRVDFSSVQGINPKA